MPTFNSIIAWVRHHRLDTRLENFFHRWGAVVVVIFAAVYYAQYWRSGLNLGGEGGTVAVVAMRLMDGWIPLKDTFLGYNLMWFYPVVWLFQIFGPNYLVLRIFFFVLCTLSGLMAFFIIRRVTGSGWFATATALLPVLIPGMQFRNYMAFLAVLNTLTFLQAYVFTQKTPRAQLLWMAAAGGSLGLTFLVRIDLGIFFLLLATGLIVLYPLVRAGGFFRNLGRAGLAAAILAGMLVFTHLPFYVDARIRGFDEAFVGQYTGWSGLIRSLLADRLGFDPFASSPAARPIYTPSRVQLIGLWLAARAAGDPAQLRDIGQDEYRQKADLEELTEAKSWSAGSLVAATYLPIPAAVLMTSLAGLAFLVALWRQDEVLREQSVATATTTGAALTLFPQFFFFRPDTPHLSEFMVPFMIAMACAGWLVIERTRTGRRGVRRFGYGFATFCGLITAIYVSHALPKESAGTIAAARKRNREMRAENGVHVLLKKGEREEVQQLADLIKERTRPGDYVACYPYQPTVNFLTDRPAYEYNLYVDNAHNVTHFHEETLAKIEKFRPAAIVIDNRPVNQTDESRFQSWAAETYAWVQAHYISMGTFRRQEVFLRPDLAPIGPLDTEMPVP